MQSQTPCIIKHYVPLQFSHHAIDMHTPPKQSYIHQQDNPLQNIKLRQLQKKSDPQFLLIFTNKSQKQYRPKKQLKYTHLFHQIKEQHNKMQIIRKLIQTSRQKQTTKARAKTSERPPQYKPLTSRTKTRDKLLNQQDFIDDNKNNLLESTRNIYSSIHIRNTKSRYNHRRTLKAKTVQNKIQTNEQQPSMRPLKLKVRGNKAPTLQIVDHLHKYPMGGSVGTLYSLK